MSWRYSLVFLSLFFAPAAFSGVTLNQGFDDFHLGARPADWIFHLCGENTDTYTDAVDSGESVPSIRLSQDKAAVTTETFDAADPNALTFWIKGMGADAASSLLVEEYYSTWSKLTTIQPLPANDAAMGPLRLHPHTTRVRFIYNKSAGDLALDDVRVHSGAYMRVYYLCHSDYGFYAAFGQIIYAELPGEDGILGTGDDRNLLYDGGAVYNTPSALSKFLDEKIGPGGTIHFMVLSHPHTDHYQGLRMAVERYQVHNFYENSRWPRGMRKSYDQLIAAIEAAGVDVYYFAGGDYLSGPDTTLGPGWDPRVEARVLAARAGTPGAGNPNDWSGVIQVRNQYSVFLWGADAPQSVERWILNNDPTHSCPGARHDLAATDIYQVHHHGGHNSSGADFLKQMSPKYAIVPVGHRTGSHPRREAMGRIHDAGAILYRNDLDHHVEVRCDDASNFEITRHLLWSPQTDRSFNPAAAYQLASGPNITNYDDLITAPPSLVTGLKVDQATPRHVVLSWNSLGPGYSYDLYRSRQKGGDNGAGRAVNPEVGEATGIYEKITSSPVFFTSFTDATLPAGVPHYYRVSSLKTVSQESGGTTFRTRYERRWSNEVRGVR